MAMSDIAPAPPPRVQRRCRYRVVGSGIPGRFAVIERISGDMVEAGFDSYEAAWSWIVNRVDGRA
jgi:hypothetical protein